MASRFSASSSEHIVFAWRAAILESWARRRKYFSSGRKNTVWKSTPGKFKAAVESPTRKIEVWGSQNYEHPMLASHPERLLNGDGDRYRGRIGDGG